jgi:hypothetical protein
LVFPVFLGLESILDLLPAAELIGLIELPGGGAVAILVLQAREQLLVVGGYCRQFWRCFASLL